MTEHRRPDIPLHDPAHWPVRMTRTEVAAVHQRSVSWLRNRVAARRYPRADSDGRWSRDVVERYAAGGIKEFDKLAAKEQKKAMPKVIHGTSPDRPTAENRTTQGGHHG